MALDGIVVASLAKELQENFTNARLSKIAQPEKDELLLTLKGPNGQKRLLLSAVHLCHWYILPEQINQAR